MLFLGELTSSFSMKTIDSPSTESISTEKERIYNRSYLDRKEKEFDLDRYGKTRIRRKIYRFKEVVEDSE